MSRLLAGQYSTNNGEMAYCRFCCHGFAGKCNPAQSTRLQDAKRCRDEHEKECFVHGGQLLVFPEEDYVEFKNYQKQVEEPFVVYADFESILQPMESGTEKTKKVQKHHACSFTYFIVSRIPGITFEPKEYVGKNAGERFLTELQNDYYTKIKPLIDHDKEMIFDDEAEIAFDDATECHICSKTFENEKDKVRDHCHFTGKFRGAAHLNCNLQYKISKQKYKLHVIFHNLRGYDAHLLMQSVQKKHGKITVIPTNMEKYISFSIGPLKFLDSMQFLTSSLEKLASALQPHQFENLKKHLTTIGTSTHLLPDEPAKTTTTPKRKGSQISSVKKPSKRPRCEFIDDEAFADGSSDEDFSLDDEDDGFVVDENCEKKVLDQVFTIRLILEDSMLDQLRKYLKVNVKTILKKMVVKKKLIMRNLNFSVGKGCFVTTTLIVLNGFMKQLFQLKRNSLISCIRKMFLMKIMSMQKMYGESLDVKLWQIIFESTTQQMF